MTKIKKIGILTAGGDCPGLNAVIRAVVKTAVNKYGIKAIGFKDGYDGLIKNTFVDLGNREVSGILTLGGTILGTSNIANPYHYAIKKGGKIIFKDVSKKAIRTYKKNKIDALVIIGGDGTLSNALKLKQSGLNVVGVPKTIDNDLSATDLTFGYDSALTTATEAIDKLHTTAQSHHRVMIVEVMGRYAGWIALAAGMAGGGDVILIPEIPYIIQKVCGKIEERNKAGKRFSIIVVAEGAKPEGGELTVSSIVESSFDRVRLGGIAYKLAEQIEKIVNMECRATILGHVQRGGTPTAFDRILATRYGVEAMNLVIQRKFGKMVALHGNKMISVPIEKAVDKLKLVPKNSGLVRSLREMGVSFGD
ncbi:MAG: ATP-dependent 6-phosphofructokinase [Candidatus Omnitrophica bacterium]|nr:ATP-dependent 6-phosphofructokinase [Candidatus Omnitrophota bacterium]